MKYLAVLLFMICLSSCSKEMYLFSYFKDNGQDGLHFAASKDGYQWEALRQDSSFLKPTAGTDKLMRDPCIIKGRNGKFHLVWTVSWNERGIGYAHSKDLIHWSEQRYIPVMEHEAGARNSWAPEVTYDKSSDLYVIYWATTIEGKFPETVVSESKYNHRLYYTTTRDFEKFAETKMFYNKAFNVIDGSVQKTGDHYTMFLKDETLSPKPEKNIRTATADSILGPYSAPSAPITGNYRAEGPTAVKIKDYWIVYFDKYQDHKMGAVRSKDLIHWEDISDQVTFPAGTRHGTVFEVSKSVYNRLKK